MLKAGPGIASNLARLRDEIASSAIGAGRDPSEITLIGVSKTQPAELVAEAVRAGVEHLGENRVQEAADKIPLVRDLLVGTRQPTWHLVGHLQSNKAGAAAGLFEAIDSVDSVHVAEALSRRVHDVLRVLIEVYVGDDPNRPGVRPEVLEEVVGGIAALPNLWVKGLMTIAPLGGDPRAAFKQVRELRNTLSGSYPRVDFGVLSMGMSEDFRVAIEEGSTQVRIGTALFGPRRGR